jgi:hypothetical protein
MIFQYDCGHLRTHFLARALSHVLHGPLSKHRKNRPLRCSHSALRFYLRTFADMELASCCPGPEVRNSPNPAKSGHYPARRYFVWPPEASYRKPLSFKHIRRHRASPIGYFAIYPAIRTVARARLLVARKTAVPAQDFWPADVRKVLAVIRDRTTQPIVAVRLMVRRATANYGFRMDSACPEMSAIAARPLPQH